MKKPKRGRIITENKQTGGYGIFTPRSDGSIYPTSSEKEFKTYNQALKHAKENLKNYVGEYIIAQVHNQLKSKYDILNRDELQQKTYAEIQWYLQTYRAYREQDRPYTPLKLTYNGKVTAVDKLDALKHKHSYGRPMMAELKDGKITEAAFKDVMKKAEHSENWARYQDKKPIKIVWEKPDQAETNELLKILPEETAETLRNEWVLDAI